MERQIIGAWWRPRVGLEYSPLLLQRVVDSNPPYTWIADTIYHLYTCNR